MVEVTTSQKEEIVDAPNFEKELQEYDEHVSPFKLAIQSFLEYTTSQYETLPIITKALATNIKMRKQTFDRFLERNKLEKESDNKSEEKRIAIPKELVPDVSKFIHALNTGYLSARVVKSNSVVAIVSQYDAFLSDLIKIYYNITPQAFDDSEKKFSIGQILQYGSIEEFKNSLIEKDVENILRSSHTDQIDWISKKLEIPLTKNLDIYPNFVEITERRNLFVHANGKVSKQYLKVCKEYKVSGIDDIEVGQQLDCDNEYVTQCFNVFFEMGVKLGVVMWHKLKPEEAEDLYGFYDPLCYKLIKEQRYDLALKLLNFILEPVFKKDCPYAYKLVFTINKALCYLLKSEKKKAKDIVAKLDCSATEPIYRLAVCVIKEEYDKAVGFMKEMGNDKRYKDSYKEWPLFTLFRETELFKQTFKEIFNEDYIFEELADDEFNTLLDKALAWKEASLDNGQGTSEEQTELTVNVNDSVSENPSSAEG